MTLRTAGILLAIGGVITLLLDAAGLPEDLLEWSYDSLLSGLDIPPDPSQAARDIVRYTALLGGVLELAVGLAILVIVSRRDRA